MLQSEVNQKCKLNWGRHAKTTILNILWYIVWTLGKRENFPCGYFPKHTDCG